MKTQVHTFLQVTVYQTSSQHTQHLDVPTASISIALKGTHQKRSKSHFATRCVHFNRMSKTNILQPKLAKVLVQ